METKWIDLGLPSGNLWSESNSSEYFSFKESLKLFPTNLPTEDDFLELCNFCKLIWKGNGYQIIGSNNNSIFLPLTGYKSIISPEEKTDNSIYDLEGYGYYWVSNPDTLTINNKYFYLREGTMAFGSCDKRYRHKIRFVKHSRDSILNQIF